MHHVVRTLGMASLVLVWLTGASTLLAASAQEEQARQLLDQALPHLEVALGCKPNHVPPVRVANADDVAHWQQQHIQAQVQAQFPDLAGEMLARTVTACQEACRSATVACYQPATREILLLPDQGQRIAHWDVELRSVASPKFLQLALVHETARALLEQKYDFEQRRADGHDAETYLALQALIEGRAQWLTQQVAIRLGSVGEFPLLAQVLVHVPDTFPDPGLRAATQEVLRQQYWAYTKGLAFYCALEDAGIRDAEQRTLGKRPCPLAWINEPERWLRAAHSRRPALAELLHAVEEALPQSSWSVQQQPWTADMVVQVANMLGERRRAEQTTRTWEEGRLLVWTDRTSPARQVAVCIVRFETPVAARAYSAFAADLQRKQDQDAGAATLGVRVREPKSKTLTIPAVEEAVWTDQKLQVAHQPPTPVSRLRARSGPLVFEMTWHGLPGDPAWAERIIGIIRSSADRPTTQTPREEHAVTR